MENIHKIILILSIIFMWAPMLRPPVHKILRNRKTYTGFMYFSVLLPIISFATWNIDLSEKEKSSAFMAFYPIIYLFVYKIFDNIILKKYNRHLIYTVQYNVVWVDDESDNAKSLDNLFEFLLIMVPILIPWGLSFLILQYCC
jgi:predicted neutral ceramidase superfamily lipid hydrolase